MANEDTLSRELAFRIEKLVGAKVESYRRVTGGYTPALRLLCTTTSASFFVKAGATLLTSESLNREIRIYNRLNAEFMQIAQWLESALPTLLQYEAACSTTGDRLTHLDLRSDNICLTAKRAVFIDWNAACLSNPRLDLGFSLPSLAYESGTEPEKILPDAPEVAAWVSGYFAARAGLPDISDAPRVREIQRRQLQTALPWAARALDLQPVTFEDPAR